MCGDTFDKLKSSCIIYKQSRAVFQHCQRHLSATQPFLLIFIFIRAIIAFKRMVSGLPSHSSSNTHFLPSRNPSVHSKNVAQLITVLPYTNTYSSLISMFVFPTFTRNFMTIRRSIFVLISMFDKNRCVQCLNISYSL